MTFTEVDGLECVLCYYEVILYMTDRWLELSQ